MLTMLGTPRRFCDGITRRESLQAGALAVLGGFGLPDLLRAEATRRPDARPGKAKNVIVLFLVGGRRRRTCTTSSRTPRPRSAASSNRSPPASRASRSASTCRGVARWMHKIGHRAVA